MKERIERIRERYASSDPFELCRRMGITVLCADLPESTGGLYFRQDGRKIILINRLLDEGRARFICAHELGHAVLHEDMNELFLSDKTLFVSGRREREADEFAARLLIDDERLRSPEYEGFSAGQLAAVFGVPERLIGLVGGEAQHG